MDTLFLEALRGEGLSKEAEVSVGEHATTEGNRLLSRDQALEEGSQIFIGAISKPKGHLKVVAALAEDRGTMEGNPSV
jgi:hypothetical protein